MCPCHRRSLRNSIRSVCRLISVQMWHRSQRICQRHGTVSVLHDLPPLTAQSCPLALDDICSVDFGIAVDREDQHGIHIHKTVVSATTVDEGELLIVRVAVGDRVDICTVHPGRLVDAHCEALVLGSLQKACSVKWRTHRRCLRDVEALQASSGILLHAEGRALHGRFIGHRYIKSRYFHTLFIM